MGVPKFMDFLAKSLWQKLKISVLAHVFNPCSTTVAAALFFLAVLQLISPGSVKCFLVCYCNLSLAGYAVKCKHLKSKSDHSLQVREGKSVNIPAGATRVSVRTSLWGRGQWGRFFFQSRSRISINTDNFDRDGWCMVQTNHGLNQVDPCADTFP